MIFNHCVLGDQKFEYQNYWQPPKVRLEDSKEEAIMLIGGKHCMKSTCEAQCLKITQKCLICNFSILAFSTNFIKKDLSLVPLFDHKLQVFKNSPQLAIFWHF